MKKVLFITTRNVLTTCGELRLIKNRSNTLLCKWGIHTDVIVLTNEDRINNRNEKLEFCTRETIIPLSKNNPFSLLSGLKSSKSVINQYLSTNDYSVVVLSGFCTLYLAKYIKMTFPNIRLIADIHGSNEDVLHFSKGKGILKKVRQSMIFHISNHCENTNMKYMDGAFVVTNGLKKYLEKRCHIDQLNSYIAPCAVSSDIFSEKEQQEYRNTYRENYSIEEDTILFVYSGGVSPWQCIEESIALYKQLKNDLRQRSKMLILSHAKDDIRRIAGENVDIIIDSYSADEVKKVICAGDFAFMLRKDCVTNNVAYPNKFLEYVESGMRVITTPFLFDIADQVDHYNMGCLYDWKNYKELLEYVDEYAFQLTDVEDRKKLLTETGFVNRLERFVADYFVED